MIVIVEVSAVYLINKMDLINKMESILSGWGLEDQNKEQSKPLKFSVRNIGTFIFGEICGLKIALWDEDDDLNSDGIKEVLQCFSAAKCVVHTGYAVAFEKTCKRGDIIVSDCIDGVQTLNTDRDKNEDVVKYSFYPDDTRFTPVPKALKGVFNNDWEGILCTEQRQRKSKVVKGTIMATTRDILEAIEFKDNMMIFDQLQKQKIHCGFSLGSMTLLQAVKECEKEVIFVCGVAYYVSEFIHDNFKDQWFPTVTESLASYIKFTLEKSASYFSGRYSTYTSFA